MPTYGIAVQLSSQFVWVHSSIQSLCTRLYGHRLAGTVYVAALMIIIIIIIWLVKRQYVLKRLQWRSFVKVLGITARKHVGAEYWHICDRPNSCRATQALTVNNVTVQGLDLVYSRRHSRPAAHDSSHTSKHTPHFLEIFISSSDIYLAF